MIIPKRRKRNISSTYAGTGKHVPQRTCVACRQIKTKRELVRVVQSIGGKLEVDLTGKKEGRGAYLCKNRACWDKALKGNQLEHALKKKIAKDDLEQLATSGKEILKELTSG